MPAGLVGMPWFKRDDYARILQIMQDAHRLPATFDEWRKKAGGGESVLRREGHVVVRAVIDPDDFPVWCRARGLDIDAKARTAFASQFALRRVEQLH